MGITNIISRAELAAIAAAVIHGYSHIATDSLTSLHQIKKQLSHPNLHRHHIQGDVLQSIAKAIRQSPSPIQFYKVKSHAGIIGNEHADALAKKPATTYADIADISIRTAGSERNPFYNIHWLAKEDIENQMQTHNHTHTTNMAHSPPSKLRYLSNPRDALQAHMQFLHKLGNVKTEANYHAYYQTLK
jgi:ribonuclease HI